MAFKKLKRYDRLDMKTKILKFCVALKSESLTVWRYKYLFCLCIKEAST